MREFDRLVSLMARLRSPGGCPWDREQTHQSIRKYVIEEAYEVAEAIDRDDPGELRTELGDLLLQVVFHARMAEEDGRFAIADVCDAICEKLERRHPHVFGEISVRDAAEVTTNWEAIKVRERGPGASAIDGVPRALPALQRAERVSEKAAGVGFDWASAGDVLGKVDEERAELGEALAGGDAGRMAAELGDLLLTLANLARKLGIEPELALTRAVDRFESRFREMEASAARSGEELRRLDPDELEDRWQAAKRRVDLPGGDR
jgi:tetrapyrrole methylase family protein/MazG family protein